MTNDLVIAVTGLNTGENPQPGVPVIRSLRRAGFSGKIIGLAYDSFESGIYAPDLADEIYVMPFPSAGLDTILSRIGQILNRTKIDILIPTLDSEILPYISLEKQLKAMGKKCICPPKNSS